MSNEILCKETKGIAEITLNRPKTLNAFSLTMAEQLNSTLIRLVALKNIRIILIRGSGRAFSAGGDIKVMSQCEDLPKFFDEISAEIHRAVLAIRGLPATVIAVCNGPVSGVAFGLAAACDLRIASTEATFHAGTTALGLAPNGSLSYFLPRLIGWGRAAWMLLTAEKISAQTAFEWGLVNEIATPEKLQERVEGWSQKLLAKAPFAQRKIKELFGSHDHDLAAHLDRERAAISASAGTNDFKEGIAAFLAKRTPKFDGP